MTKLDTYASRDEHHAARVDWLLRKHTSFDFAASILDQLSRHGWLSDRQEIAIDRCIDREAPAAWRAQEPSDSGLDLSPLPSGYYAVPNGKTRLKVRIKRPGKQSRWEGWTFVSDGAVYGQGRNYGKQPPDGVYRGDIVEQLRAILDDPKAAMAEYGKLTGVCGRCGRPLEDELSVERGIGPICWGKM